MNRKYRWLAPVAFAAIIFGALVAWPWYRDRPARAAADTLIADLEDHGGQLEQQVKSFPSVADRATNAELVRQLSRLSAELGEATKRSRELAERTREVLPQTPEGKREELSRALERYTARVGPAVDAYKVRSELLRGKLVAQIEGGKPER